MPLNLDIFCVRLEITYSRIDNFLHGEKITGFGGFFGDLLTCRNKDTNYVEDSVTKHIATNRIKTKRITTKCITIKCIEDRTYNNKRYNNKKYNVTKRIQTKHLKRHKKNVYEQNV